MVNTIFAPDFFLEPLQLARQLHFFHGMFDTQTELFNVERFRHIVEGARAFGRESGARCIKAGQHNDLAIGRE